MTDHATSKGGTLIWVEMVAAEFAMSHAANRVYEVGPVEILKPVLIRVVGVGTTVEIIGRRIFPTFLVTCILRPDSVHVQRRTQKEHLRGSLLR